MTPPEEAVPIESLLRHRAWVRSVARALMGGEHEADADDLEQEAWLAAAKHPPPDESSPRAWLGTVLRRTAAKLRLSEARRDAREQAVGAAHPLASAADLVAEAEMHERLVRSVLGLPEPYRTVILRRYFQQLSPREIASLTGSPPGTVRAQLSRALALLRSSVRGNDAGAWPAPLVALAASGSAEAGGAVAAGVVLMTQAKATALVGLAIAVSIGIVIWAAIRDQFEPARSDAIGGAPAAASDAPRTELPKDAVAPVPLIHPRAVDSRFEAGAPSLTVNVKWAEDGTPAEGVAVQLIESGTRTGIWKERWFVTGPDGVVRATHVTPGRVVAYGDRGGSVGTTVGDGEAEPLTLEIPPGATVEGRVVALDGTPVAGADIWLSQYGNIRFGAVVTRSDAGGAFKLRSVRDFHSLAARAHGHSQSEPHQISNARPGEVVKVELRLGGPAGSVRGVVLGPDGVPVMSAAVEMLSPPIRSFTDDQGVFVIGSLPPGENAIEVRTPGFAPWKGAARVTAGEVTAVEVRLQKEAAVFGTARLVSGAPAANADVWAGGVRGHFLSSTAYTAADGSFRLGSLAPGTVEISASLRETGKASATLACAEGGEVRWDPVIDPGLTIAGYVRDDADKPLADWVVFARWNDRRDRTASPTGATTDATGRFWIIGCPDAGPYRLEARPKIESDGKERAYLDGVTPGDVEHVIRVSTKVMGIVKGRVIRHDGSPAAAEVMLRTERDDRAAFVKTDPKTGAFSSPWLVPGRWRVTVEKDRVGDVEGGEHDLGPGETLDLGDIKLPEPGTLVIELDAPEAIADQVVYSILPQVDRTPWRIPTWIRSSFKIAHKDLPKPFLFPAGSYTIDVSGPRVERQNLAFTIEPGKETRVAVGARAGIACELRFSFPAGEPRSDVGYHFIPESGGKTVSGSAHWNGIDEMATGTSVVQPGTYKLQATSSTRLRKEQGVVVSAGETKVVFAITLESPWPADGLPVTFRFKPPQGQERYRFEFFVLDPDGPKPKLVGDGGTTISDAGAIEAKGRLKPGSYALVLTQPLQPRRQPFVVKPGDPAQVFEFTVDPP